MIEEIMKRKTIRCILILLFMLNAAVLSAQKNKQPVVKVLAWPQQHAVLLRWAPDNATAWRVACQYGYNIERQTIVRNKEVLKKTEKKILNAKPILPLPLEAWKKMLDSNGNARIAAQAIYGKDFNINMNSGSSPVTKILNQAKENDLRYSFALFACDQNFEVATMAGVGYTDSDAKENEMYLKIESNS